jgi:hypothetical protein
VADPSETTLASGAPASEEAAELLGAVRALSEQVGSLQAELRAQRPDSRQLPPGGTDVPGWEVEAAPPRRDGSPWLRSVSSPTLRPPAIPPLFVEILFLIAVACLAAVARLDTIVVIAVMAGAWALVALAEWSAARAARLRNEAAFGRYGAEGAWFTPRRPGTTGPPAGTEGVAPQLPPPPSD